MGKLYEVTFICENQPHTRTVSAHTAADAEVQATAAHRGRGLAVNITKTESIEDPEYWEDDDDDDDDDDDF